MQKKIFYSWAQFEKDCERIARWAQQYGFETIYGIPRAGALVAARVAQMLDIEMIADPHEIDPKKTLVVDDIVRNGDTLTALEEHIGEVVAATLVYTGGKTEPNFYARKKIEDVSFPWERKLEGIDTHNFAKTLVKSTFVDVVVKTDKQGLA